MSLRESRRKQQERERRERAEREAVEEISYPDYKALAARAFATPVEGMEQPPDPKIVPEHIWRDAYLSRTRKTPSEAAADARRWYYNWNRKPTGRR